MMTDDPFAQSKYFPRLKWLFIALCVWYLPDTIADLWRLLAGGSPFAAIIEDESVAGVLLGAHAAGELLILGGVFWTLILMGRERAERTEADFRGRREAAARERNGGA